MAEHTPVKSKNEPKIDENKNKFEAKPSYVVYDLDGDRLSLLISNFSDEEEQQLHKAISPKFPHSNAQRRSDNILQFEFNYPGNDQPAACFYMVISDNRNLSILNSTPSNEDVIEIKHNAVQRVVCFVGTSNNELELFRNEMVDFINKTSFGWTEVELANYLIQWRFSCMDYLSTCIPLFTVDHLARFIHSAFGNAILNLSDNLKDDQREQIMRFQDICSLRDLLPNSVHDRPETVLAFHDDFVTVSGVSNEFCTRLAQIILPSSNNPLFVREAIEKFKMTIIQNLNTLKRFLREAELSHYALYKCYAFLTKTGNCDLLMDFAKWHHSTESESKQMADLIHVLKEFLNGRRALNDDIMTRFGTAK